jgi:voltage-gated potassium channel
MVFTIVLILAGVGTVLYAISAVMSVIIEGDLLRLVGRRRMDRKIAAMTDHIVLCGWGRVGQAIGHDLARAGTPVVVVDSDENRIASTPFAGVVGDATNDEVLRQAGVERASVLVAAVTSDADNLFVTLSGRALNARLFIVARARQDASSEKLLRAGADRVVNPQQIGGARMAAFIMQPNVAEFLDVVMHDQSLEFRLAEIHVAADSIIVGTTLENVTGGARVLARRSRAGGRFDTGLNRNSTVEAGDVLIAVGTDEDLGLLAKAASDDHRRPRHGAK